MESDDLHLQIQHWLRSYLDNNFSLEEFQDWFVAASWNVSKSGNWLATRLTYAIELKLAEYTSGHWSESDLHLRLEEVLAEPETLHPCPDDRAMPALAKSRGSSTEFIDLLRPGHSVVHIELSSGVA